MYRSLLALAALCSLAALPAAADDAALPPATPDSVLAACLRQAPADARDRPAVQACCKTAAAAVETLDAGGRGALARYLRMRATGDSAEKTALARAIVDYQHAADAESFERYRTLSFDIRDCGGQ